VRLSAAIIAVARWHLTTKALPPGRYTIRLRTGATKKIRIRAR
jgi:hypothetical protein